MSFNPSKRYSAVAVFSEDLERVVLIHKQKPAWQAGKANVPGGKVESEDYKPIINTNCHQHCAARELREETGLDITTTALQLFCRLRFKTLEGNAAECYFYATKGDIEAARTIEEEHIFVGTVADVMLDDTGYRYPVEYGTKYRGVPTMPNLPYLVAMARQCLRGVDVGSWPLTIYEAGAL